MDDLSRYRLALYKRPNFGPFLTKTDKHFVIFSFHNAIHNLFIIFSPDRSGIPYKPFFNKGFESIKRIGNKVSGVKKRELVRNLKNTYFPVI